METANWLTILAIIYIYWLTAKKRRNAIVAANHRQDKFKKKVD